MKPRIGPYSSALRITISSNVSGTRVRNPCLARAFTQTLSPGSQDQESNHQQARISDLWNKYSLKDHRADEEGGRYVGFLGKKRNISKHLSFADLTLPTGEVIQLCTNTEIDEDAHQKLRQLQAHAPVALETHDRELHENAREDANTKQPRRTVYVKDIRPLNAVPTNLIVTHDSRFPYDKRHLQIRFHPELQARLRFRSWLKGKLNQALLDKGFIDVETPTLFKSTPEGAREFLVPTRKKGKAYALSQSPQQYKQALMTTGISRYMQWARCYRDEDHRADRQPEFSQLDMEWAFAGAATVREDVDDIILQALEALATTQSYREFRGERVPIPSDTSKPMSSSMEHRAHSFTHLTFAESIAAYGSDKPDLRIPGRIHAIQDVEPFQNFVSMITHLEDPLIEVFALSLNDCSPEQARKLVFDFMENLPPEIGENPDGKPQVLIFDTSKPLAGLSSVGHEYQQVLDLVSEGRELNDGDLIVFQARQKPQGQYCLSSTKLGDLRRDLWKRLVEEGWVHEPQMGDPGSLQFAWITEFPMFKPAEDGEPGQGGAAGISACHHPFTAPLSANDLELLFTTPLEAKSAAYDLVLNGVEIGGGSERNHIVDIQEFIMRDVLKMKSERIQDFSHLLEALRMGCPPHAGFALGFDRMVAVMSGTPTVRDVIAFPKNMHGEDAFTKSPRLVTNQQLAPYGLQLKEKGEGKKTNP